MLMTWSLGELEERAHLSAHAQVLRHHGGLCSNLRCGVGAGGPGLGAEAFTVAHGAWAAALRRRPSDGGRLPQAAKAALVHKYVPR